MMPHRSYTVTYDFNDMTGKRIKNIIIVILKTVLVVFLAATLAGIFMPKYIFENQDGRITQEYYPNACYTDVVFAGPSTAFSGIDPRVLFEQNGISSYVRANASQTMWISYYMLEDAVKVHRPELICLDVTFIKYDDDFVEEPSTHKALDCMRLSRSKIECAKASMGKDEKLADYIYPLFRFHSRWKDLSIDDIKYAWYFKNVTKCGYIADTETDPADPGDLVYSRPDDDIIGPKTMGYLERIMKLCDDNGIQLLLFKTPAHSDNWSVSLDRQIEDKADEYGITYINFDALNDDIGLDYSLDTPDKGAHLNDNGAVKFSKYLGDYIMRTYNVSDRRGQNSYVRHWNRIGLR